MSYKKGEFLYEGKAKTIYSVLSDENFVWLEFKNSLTAFNAQKKGEFEGKGKINLEITNHIFKYLQSNDIKTHWVQEMSESEVVCQKLSIIPLEVVVRNITAGSLAKKFNLKEGVQLKKPLVEFFYKKDELGDPFISDEQALVLGFVESQKTLDDLKSRALKINELLIQFFDKCEISLVDFKLEFGFDLKNNILLADEITPDSCRLWNKKTGEKMDKDRFRQDLGLVKESYEEILLKIQQNWSL